MSISRLKVLPEFQPKQTTSKIWRPYTQHALQLDPIHVEKAKDAYLYCKDGKKIMDAISSWWVTLHGHCHPSIVEAIQKQSEKLEQVVFSGFTHDPAEELSEKLVEITTDNLNYVFYSDNGSTAVEVALKMAVGYWRNQGNKTKNKFISFDKGYHGDTIGAMTVSSRGPFVEPYTKMLFDHCHIPFPKSGKEDITLLKLRRYLEENSEQIAGLIVEPLITGAGGMLTYSSWALKVIYDLCRSYDVLFIADEAMTGFGRTGSMFACDQANIDPDIMCLSKGITGGFLPLGVTMASERIYNAFYSEDRSKTFFHGHSYTGNPISCAASVANLTIFDKESVFSRIRRISDFHSQNLYRFQHYEKVKEVRQCGTIAIIELESDNAGYLAKEAKDIYKYFIEKNILLRPLGNVFYILPPYCIINEQLGEIYKAIEDFIKV